MLLMMLLWTTRRTKNDRISEIISKMKLLLDELLLRVSQWMRPELRLSWRAPKSVICKQDLSGRMGKKKFQE